MDSVEGDSIRLLSTWLPPLLNTFTLLQAAELGLMLILILCSALFSIAETAFFSLNNKDLLEIRQRNTPLHKAILSLHDKSGHLPAVVFIVNTLISVIIALLAIQLLNRAGLGPDNFAGQGAAIILIAFVLVLFNEAIPKKIGARYNVRLASATVYPLVVLTWLLSPFTVILTATTRLMENRIRRGGPNVAIDDIHHAIEMTSAEETTREEKKILRGVVNLGSTLVSQIMCSRRDIVAHDIRTPFDQLVAAINENRYSRLPVYSSSIDNIKGILYIKDLVPYLNEGPDFQWQSLIREPHFVSVNEKIDTLLQEFKQMKVHMAVVRTEQGRTAGIVTMEDIVEEIVGDIRDEFDEEEVAYSRLDEDTFVFDGRTSLSDVVRIMDVPEEELIVGNGQVESIGALVTELAGHVPDTGQTIKCGNFVLTAELTDRRRVRRVKVKRDW